MKWSTHSESKHDINNIITVSSYQDAIRHINHQQRTLVLFDIDDNLITTVGLNPADKQNITKPKAHARHHQCGPASDNWLKTILKQGADFSTVIGLYDFLQSFIITQPVEPDHHYRLPEQKNFDPNNKLQGLVDQGHIILGITSRGPKTAGNTEYQLRQCGFRFRDLHHSNIDTRHCDMETFLLHEPAKQKTSTKLLHHNVIYCEGSDKGKVLNAFLQHTQYGRAIMKKGFKQIFFMDDDRYKCEAIRNATQHFSQPVINFHNTYMVNHYTPYAKIDSTTKEVNQHTIKYYQQFFCPGLSQSLSKQTRSNKQYNKMHKK